MPRPTGELNYGSPGIGTGGHLVTALLLTRTGIDAVHVPYQATTQQLLAAAGGHLHFTFDTVGNARGLVEGGKVRPSRRDRRRPRGGDARRAELRRTRLSGLRWIVRLDEHARPRRHAAGDHRRIKSRGGRCQSQPDIKARLEQGSYEPGLLSVQETVAFFDNDIRNWSQVVRETGVHIKA